MKKMTHYFLAILLFFSALSCREANTQAETPADTRAMEGVQESKKAAIEKEEKQTAAPYPKNNSDSLQ